MAELNDVLTGEQQAQIVRLLVEIMSAGAGRLEIRIDKCRIHFFRPAKLIYHPGGVCRQVDPQPLELLLGEWLAPVLAELVCIQAAGFGEVWIGIEYGRVTHIGSMPDVRPAVGE